MSRSFNLLPPLPVEIGYIKCDSEEKQLHDQIRHGNYIKVKKILKKGINADSVNCLGQTPLYIAALLGLPKLIDLLLKFGADPNHRCFDWSTPVHAAAYSCNPWILSKLIDAGGDLRLHDVECRKPYSWAVMAGKEKNTQMLEFMERCATQTQALIQCFPYTPFTKTDSSQVLIDNPSVLDLISQRNSDRSLSKILKCEGILSRNMSCYGYGKLCVTGGNQLASMAYIPLIEEKNIIQGDDNLSFSFSVGPYMTMTNLLWGYTKVTVKELNMSTRTDCSKSCFADLLITEQEHMSKLHHPHVLQLIAVCASPDLERTSLVFERVTFGSLHNILHERRSEFPILHLETILHFLLQVIEGLIFLHWRGFIHRSFSSHAVQIVAAGMAKIGNFEYMIESKDERTCDDNVHFTVPAQLYRWSAPEVIFGKTVTVKSDIYSFCVVMQEVLTDTLPWDGLDGPAIKEAIVSHRYLVADTRLSKPYDDIISIGIQSKPKGRTMNLQDIRCLLKNDFKNIVESRNDATVSVNLLHQGAYPDPNICLQPCRMITKELCNQKRKESITSDRHKSFEEELAGVNHSHAPVVDGYPTTQSLEGLPNDPQQRLFMSIKAPCGRKVSFIPESHAGALRGPANQDKALGSEIKNQHEKSNEKSRPSFLHGNDLDNHSASEISFSETDIESTTGDEDSSVENSDDWHTEIQFLENTLSSMRKYITSSIVHLTFSQNTLEQHNKTTASENKTKHMDERFVEPSNQCYPYDSMDEVDNVISFLKSNSCAKLCAVGPPDCYRPPESGSCTMSDQIQEQAQRQCAKTSLNSYASETNREERLYAREIRCKQRPTNVDRRGRADVSPTWSLEVRDKARRVALGELCVFQHYQQLSSKCENMGDPFLDYRGKQCKHVQHLENSNAICSDESTDDDSENDTSRNGKNIDSKLEKIFQSFAVRGCHSSDHMVNQTEDCDTSLSAPGRSLRDPDDVFDELQDSSLTKYFTADLGLSLHSDAQTEMNTLQLSEEEVDVTGCSASGGKVVPVDAAVRTKAGQSASERLHDAQHYQLGDSDDEELFSLGQKQYRQTQQHTNRTLCLVPESTDEDSDLGEGSLEKDKDRKLQGRRFKFTKQKDLIQTADHEISVVSAGKSYRDQNTPFNSHDSSVAKYFTPEHDLSSSSGDQSSELEPVNLSKEFAQVHENVYGCTSESTVPGKEQLFDMATEKRSEKGLSEVSRLSISANARSVIDIQELSSILDDQNSPSMHYNTPRAKHVSSRFSTPLSLGVGSTKQHETKGLNTSCWDSQETDSASFSTKTLGPLLSASENINMQECSSHKGDPFTKYVSTASITLTRNHEKDSLNKSMTISSQLYETVQDTPHSLPLETTDNKRGNQGCKENTLGYEE